MENQANNVKCEWLIKHLTASELMFVLTHCALQKYLYHLNILRDLMGFMW